MGSKSHSARWALVGTSDSSPKTTGCGLITMSLRMANDTKIRIDLSPSTPLSRMMTPADEGRHMECCRCYEQEVTIFRCDE